MKWRIKAHQGGSFDGVYQILAPRSKKILSCKKIADGIFEEGTRERTLERPRNVVVPNPGVLAIEPHDLQAVNHSHFTSPPNNLLASPPL